MGNIVVPVDGSKHASKAIDFATTIARAVNGTLVLLNVQPQYQQAVKEEETHEKGNEAAYMEEGKKIVNEAAQYADTLQVSYETKVRIGLATIEIAQEAKEQSAMCIVMGSRAMGPDVSRALGSVSHGVLHLAACPVTFVPPLDSK